MSKLYVVSSSYLPVVTVNRTPSFFKNQIVNSMPIKKEALDHVFNRSLGHPLLALLDLEDAKFISKCLLKGHNTSSRFVESGVRLFASPVIYEVEVDDTQDLRLFSVNSEILSKYPNAEDIPLYVDYEDTFSEAQLDKLQKKLNKRETIPAYFVNLNGQNAEIQKASYYNARGIAEEFDFYQAAQCLTL